MDEEKQAAYVADIERELRYVSTWLKQRGREILHDYKITIPQFVALQWLFESGRHDDWRIVHEDVSRLQHNDGSD